MHTNGLAVLLDAGKVDSTNTITHAGGAAVWYALKCRRGTTLASVSAAVLQQICDMLLSYWVLTRILAPDRALGLWPCSAKPLPLRSLVACLSAASG